MQEITSEPELRPVNKAADTVAGVIPEIRHRWSPRAYADRDVKLEDLQTLLEGARWAASCFNEQPWRFIIARKSDTDAYHKLLDVLVPKNQQWAQAAPVLLLTVAKKTFTRNGLPNYHALHDAGLALGNLMTQATAMGLYAHAMGGYDHEKARSYFAIPEDYDTGAVVAIGYLGDADHLSEEQRKSEQSPRTRKPLDELAFTAKWGQPYSWSS